ncbi:MAG: hypothetical protein KGL53_01695, partial [Elusimicrobia bacterium]|nr:hypothetical protein [Elusimicrobiota bacterium]
MRTRSSRPLLSLLPAVLLFASPASGRPFRKPAPEEAGGVVSVRLAKPGVGLGRSVRLFVDMPLFCRKHPDAVSPRFPPSQALVRRGGARRSPDGNSFTQVFILTPQRPGILEIPPMAVRCGSWESRTFRLALKVWPPRPGRGPAALWPGAGPAASTDGSQVAALRQQVASLQQTVSQLKSRPPEPEAEPSSVPLLRGEAAEPSPIEPPPALAAPAPTAPVPAAPAAPRRAATP